jgi:hypothetical protein
MVGRMGVGAAIWLDTTTWEKYGKKSGNEKCRDCMVHCGYEATAVDYTFSSIKGLTVPRT